MPMKELTERLLSNEKNALSSTWGPYTDKLDGIYATLFFIPKDFPYKIHTEHRKLIFIFSVACLSRCGVVVTPREVRLAGKEDKDPESILSGKTHYPSSSRQKAFILIRRVIIWLFAIGAHRIALAVYNVTITAYSMPHNLDTKKDLWYDDAYKQTLALRECLLYCCNEDTKTLFEDDDLFKSLPTPPRDDSASYCAHGVILVPPFVSRCIYENQKGADYAGRMCCHGGNNRPALEEFLSTST